MGISIEGRMIFILFGNTVVLIVNLSDHQPAWVVLVYWIVVREGVRIRRRCGARNEQRVAAQEAADGRIVESRAELGDAERGKVVALVPLLVAVEWASRLCSGGGWLAEGAVVDVLDEGAAVVGDEASAALLAEGEDPFAASAVACGKEAVGAGDLAQRYLSGQQARRLIVQGEDAVVLVVTSLDNKGMRAHVHVKLLHLAEGVVPEVGPTTLVLDR